MLGVAMGRERGRMPAEMDFAHQFDALPRERTFLPGTGNMYAW
jgi:hypothetical protein